MDFLLLLMLRHLFFINCVLNLFQFIISICLVLFCLRKKFLLGISGIQCLLFLVFNLAHSILSFVNFSLEIWKFLLVFSNLHFRLLSSERNLFFLMSDFLSLSPNIFLLFSKLISFLSKSLLLTGNKRLLYGLLKLSSFFKFLLTFMFAFFICNFSCLFNFFWEFELVSLHKSFIFAVLSQVTGSPLLSKATHFFL